ncbi:alpha/beta hydrolase [Acinetobacter qingfengensis]|nr:alpha/beta hydrolase-fold protein [Acinetobacter qingfengensis]KAA8732381.1 alpha/beta hydrolase [Acinetobacter qingfengensis]
MMCTVTFQAATTQAEEIKLQQGVTLVGGHQNQQFELNSKFHAQKYVIQVYQPKTPAPKSGYPVIYLLDGNATFPYASIMAQAIDNTAFRSHKTPPLIVAIAYPTDQSFDLKARSFDYTPPYQGKLKQPAHRGSSDYTQGGAEQFFQFIQQQLKPAIAAHYTINAKQQILFGHSYGGLFTLYTFLNHPDSFQFYLAASPSIWWNDYALLRQLSSMPQQFKQPTTLWLSVGETENREKRQAHPLVQQDSDIAQFSHDLMQHKNLNVKTFELANASHIEALFAALNLVFKINQP